MSNVDCCVEVQSSLRADRLNDADRKELIFWRDSPGESGDCSLLLNVMYKAGSFRTFRELMPALAINDGDRVLELGAGQGWASVMAKQRWPRAHIVASDVSRDALLVCQKYEQMEGVFVDEKWQCGANSLPFENESFDVIFCFAAFHHLIIDDRYDETVRETLRVLKPGGRAAFLYEPSAPPLTHGLMVRLAQQRRGNESLIEEDVISLRKLRSAAEKCGADVRVDYFSDFTHRLSFKAGLYYYLMSKLPLLSAILPCTVNIHLTKVRT